MGQMRFQTPDTQRLSEEVVDRAYMCGIEGVPWRSVNSREGGQLVIQREVSESGNLHIPWETAGRGQYVLSTASLMERRQPYQLAVEVARGLLNRVRNQTSAYESAGFEFPAALGAKLREATTHFLAAATMQDDAQAAARRAEQTIDLSLAAIDLLSEECSSQLLRMRREQTPQLPTLLAAPVGDGFDGPGEQAFLAAFNSAVVPFCWRDMEPGSGERSWERTDLQVAWCKEHDRRIISGPLLQPDRTFLPDWVYLWEDDFDRLQSCVVQHVSAIARRYLDDVQVWHCAAGMNMREAMSLSDEQSLRLTLAVIDTVRQSAPKTPLFISVDQPWAEHLAREDAYFSPIHFADALVRADVGLAGIGLEINFGYWPRGTLPRDLLDFSNQIDRWTQLGLPLVILLTAPSSDSPDSSAQRQPAVGPMSPESQCELLKAYIALLLAKPAVHGLIWSQLSDSAGATFAHGGLFDADGRGKPLLDVFADLRREHLA